MDSRDVRYFLFGVLGGIAVMGGVHLAAKRKPTDQYVEGWVDGFQRRPPGRPRLRAVK